MISIWAPSEQLAARLFEFLSGPLELDTYVHYVHRRGDDDLTLAGWHGIPRHGISVSEAFERLRQHSRQNRIRIRDAAHQIVSGDLEA